MGRLGVGDGRAISAGKLRARQPLDARGYDHRTIEARSLAPHGLSYSFTLHASDGTRLVGFDNAHGVSATGSKFKRKAPASDHWHRTEDDPGRPYQYKDAETLIDDFFDEVERVLGERGIGMTVVVLEEKKRSR